VRVNCVAVGAVRAPSLVDSLHDEEVARTINAMGRIGEPDEIAYAVLYFASDAASFCSGQTLYIHGGPAGSER